MTIIQIILLLVNIILLILIFKKDNKKLIYNIKLMEKNRDTLLEYFKDNQEFTTIVREFYSDNINMLKDILNLEDNKWKKVE